MPLRSFILAAILGLPIVALLAFGPRGQVQVPTDRTVIQYWEKWTLVEGQAIKESVQRFNRTEGAPRGIWVDYRAVTNIEERLLISIAGGDPPDVAGLVDSRVAQYAANDALEPLDEEVREHRIDLGAYKPVWLELCRYDDRLFALPSTPFTIALLYNRALFREAGLDPDRPPETLAELSHHAKRLTRFDDDGRITQLGFTTSTEMLGWWPWVWSGFCGGRPWDGRRYVIDDEAGRAAAAWVDDMRTAIGRSAMLEFEGRRFPIEGADNPFLSGRLAMVFQGPWITNWIRAYAPRLDYGVARFPSASASDRNVFASEDVLVIPRGAKRPREAMIFLAWMQRQEVLEDLCKRHGKASPFRKPLPSFFADHPNPHVRTFDSLASSPQAFGFPQTPMWGEIRDLSITFMESLVRGQPPRDELIERTQKRIDAIVAGHQRIAAQRAAAAAR